jgi:uncharacterized protein (DUF3084 family)
MSRLNGLIDDYTDQICVLTHFDLDTARLLFQEIKDEPDTFNKLSKLLHLAAHELSAAQLSTTQSHSSDFALLISSVRAHWSDAPILTDSFIDWLPRKIAASRKRFSAAKSELSAQRKHNEILQKRLDQVNRDQSANPHSESETEEISRMRAQVKQFNATISALKKQVHEREFRNDDSEQERQLHTQRLRTENMSLASKIEETSDVMQKYEELLAVN